MRDFITSSAPPFGLKTQEQLIGSKAASLVAVMPTNTLPAWEKVVKRDAEQRHARDLLKAIRERYLE